MTTFTVGASGRDYTTIQAAISAGIALGVLAEPVEIVIDAGHSENSSAISFAGWNGTPTNYYWLRCATGYAAGGTGKWTLNLNAQLLRPGNFRMSDVNLIPVSVAGGDRSVLDSNSEQNHIYDFEWDNTVNTVNCGGIYGTAPWRDNRVYRGVVRGQTGTNWYEGVANLAHAEKITVYGCINGISGCAVVIDSYSGGNSGNDFASNGTISYSVSEDSTASGTGSLTGVNPATAFVDAAAGDFTLAALSPLIGAGSTGNNIGYDQITGAEEAPVITTHPTGGTVIQGDAGSFKIFTVAFTGTPTPSVQWQRDNAGDGSYTNISGATAATLTVYGDDVTVASDNGDRYRAAATNSQGTVYSNPATLAVILAPFEIVSGPTSIQRGGSYTFRIDGLNSTPTTENTTITYAGDALTVDAVTAIGGGVYDIDFTVPSGITLQYSDSVNGWTIDVDGHVAMPWETAFLPPDGWEYIVLVDPDTTSEESAFFGYTGDTPATGWQWEKETHTTPDGIRVEPEGVAGYYAIESLPLQNQTLQHRLIEPDGTLWPLATLTFGIGDDVTPTDTPDQSVTGVEPGATVTFTEFTVAGLGDGVEVSYTISNGEFAVNSGSGYGSYDGTAKNVQNGYAVTVRHESAAITGGTPGVQTTTLNQNGLLAQFTSTTRAAVAPTITAQPSNDTVEAGSPGSFSVTMTDAASYQWHLVGTGAVSGATSNTFAPTTASGDAGTTRQYYVIGTSSEGGTVQSDTVTLTITNATTTFTSAEQLRDNETKALLANTLVSYKLITADGTEVTGSATTDASGYLSDSSVEFGTAGDTVIVYGEFGTYITGFKAVLS